LIEGHTDDDGFLVQVQANNWDLSTKRATAIVAILREQSINKESLTAAGRGEFSPLTSNATPEEKSKIVE
jgi:chemotaxis protein MotB